MKVRIGVAAVGMAGLLAFGCGGGNGTDGDGGPAGSAGSGGGGGNAGGGNVGGGGAGGGSASGGPIALDQFAAAFEAALCAPLVPCGVYPNLATCEAAMVFAEDTGIETLIDGVRRGTVRYDAAAAGDCVAGLPRDCVTGLYSGAAPLIALQATTAFVVTPACPGVFTGLLADGASCVYGLECRSTSSCSNCNGGICCAGICGPDMYAGWPTVYGAGENCEMSGFCLAPSICEGTACVVPPAEGEACNPSVDFYCSRRDDYCNDTTRVCTKRLPTGAPCSDDLAVGVDPCIVADHCQSDGAGYFTCVPWPGVGEACTPYECISGLTCSDQGVCVGPAAGALCGT